MQGAYFFLIFIDFLFSQFLPKPYPRTSQVSIFRSNVVMSTMKIALN